MAIERRQHILDIAKKLFAENGYHATSMRTINKAVGMSETLTYHYFPEGKLQILHAIIQALEESRANDIDNSIKALGDHLSLEGALSLIVQKMAERFEADKDFMQIMIQERKLLGMEQITLLSNIGGGFIKTFSEFLKKRAGQGEIRDIDFDMAVSQFLCHISMIALQSILYEPSFDRDRYIKNVSGIVAFTAALWAK